MIVFDVIKVLNECTTSSGDVTYFVNSKQRTAWKGIFLLHFASGLGFLNEHVIVIVEFIIMHPVTTSSSYDLFCLFRTNLKTWLSYSHSLLNVEGCK